MHIHRINRPLFDLPTTHPARRFLEAFIACRSNCVGREIAYRGREHEAIDQTWTSATDARTWRFSHFAYKFISFEIELDGWLSNSPTPTQYENNTLQELPRLRSLMEECREACVVAGNDAVLALTNQVIDLLDLWEECIRARIATVDQSGTV
jgi:hypothetical protein